MKFIILRIGNKTIWPNSQSLVDTTDRRFQYTYFAAATGALRERLGPGGLSLFNDRPFPPPFPPSPSRHP